MILITTNYDCCIKLNTKKRTTSNKKVKNKFIKVLNFFYFIPFFEFYYNVHWIFFEFYYNVHWIINLFFVILRLYSLIIVRFLVVLGNGFINRQGLRKMRVRKCIDFWSLLAEYVCRGHAQHDPLQWNTVNGACWAWPRRIQWSTVVYTLHQVT
jgi:hypothetical protein